MRRYQRPAGPGQRDRVEAGRRRPTCRRARGVARPGRRPCRADPLRTADPGVPHHRTRARPLRAAAADARWPRWTASCQDFSVCDSGSVQPGAASAARAPAALGGCVPDPSPYVGRVSIVTDSLAKLFAVDRWALAAVGRHRAQRAHSRCPRRPDPADAAEAGPLAGGASPGRRGEAAGSGQPRPGPEPAHRFGRAITAVTETCPSS